MTLISVRIYYIACNATTISFARFPSTPAGRDAASVVTATGTCVARSNADVTPQSALCKADGSWFMVTGGCSCVAGYQPTPDNESCSGITRVRNYDCMKARHGL